MSIKPKVTLRAHIPVTQPARVLKVYKDLQPQAPMPTPPIAFNDGRVNDIPQSIKLTLAYLAACSPAFPGGKLVTRADHTETVTWSLLTVRGSGTIPELTVYLFDAHNTLLQRTIQYPKTALEKRSERFVVNPETLTPEIAAMLLDQLRKIRKHLQDTLIPSPAPYKPGNRAGKQRPATY
jgi:hypothetical protein